MTAAKHTRIEWMDIAKGIGILLVIYGHCMRDEMRQIYPIVDYTYRFCYVFHMAFFFWISGYAYQMGRAVFHKTYSGSFLVKKAKRLLVPWLLYSAFIFCVFRIAMIIPPLSTVIQSAGFGNISLPAYCLQSLQAFNSCAIHLWFVYILFLVTALVFGLEKLVPERLRSIGYLATVVLCLLGQLMLRFVKFGDWTRLITLLCRYTPFYILGIAMQGKEYQGRFSNLWCVLGLAYVLLRTLVWSDFDNGIRTGNLWGNIAVEYGAYLFLPGVFLLMQKISMCIQRHWNHRYKDPLQRLGRDSFNYYLWHQPFCCAFAGQLLYNKMGLPAALVMAVCMGLSILVPLCIQAVWRKLRPLVFRNSAAAKG